MCFKCDKEEHVTDYQQQDSSEEKENEEVAGTSDDVELVVHWALSGFQEYRKIWSPKSGQKLNIKHDKINLFDPYAMGLCCEIKGKIEFILSSDVFFEKHPDFVNISESTTVSLMRLYAQQSSIEVHCRRMA